MAWWFDKKEQKHEREFHDEARLQELKELRRIAEALEALARIGRDLIYDRGTGHD